MQSLLGVVAEGRVGSVSAEVERILGVPWKVWVNFVEEWEMHPRQKSDSARQNSQWLAGLSFILILSGIALNWRQAPPEVS